ncbi:MAG TPA: bifunctional 5,10-methylenetetrahydrofolate dehydrogenase/5,10-methenyltetrahydrofolate cyclohydrolase [Ktedonobacteraceae bacterium]|nr:bifunctional 5,10-methylenetetrahydrofolate dehydrogenase/5,10-methenyltetrahydrofolate cyclohydrolase [Ktedonobacteraceae bacterium]
MTAQLIDGRAMAAELRAELRSDVEKYVHEQGSTPEIAIVRVGSDAASGVYSKAIVRAAEGIGMVARLEQLPTRISSEELQALLQELNADKHIRGVIVQMPLPGHLSQQLVADTVAAEKDIDGISPHSAGNLFLGLPSFLPATAAAVMEILERTHTPLDGRRAVVISRSNVVGKPLALMLLQKHATVTICHSRTADLASFTRQADILVAAAGRARMITGEMIKPGATLIDVGINEDPDGSGGIVGDVDFASAQEVAGAITPVPGGVGPLTNLVLLKQSFI